MRVRLRQKVTAAYDGVRDNFVWTDHVLRLLVTAGAVAWLKPGTICDPACGDASILVRAWQLWPFQRAFLGDLSKAQIDLLARSPLPFPAEFYPGSHAQETLDNLEQPVDVVVLTEILEHVEDPDAVLRSAREAGKALVVSSPIDETFSVGNHEHLWAWDKAGYREMLEATGWSPVAYTEIGFPAPGFPYQYQIWTCR